MGKYVDAGRGLWLKFSRAPTPEEFAARKSICDTWRLALDVAVEAGAHEAVMTALLDAAEADGVDVRPSPAQFIRS